MMAEILRGFSISSRRLLEELRLLREGYPSLRMLSLEVGAPIFELTVSVNEQEHHLRIVLPPAYPRVPPEVREIGKLGGGVVSGRPGQWRLTDGQLCLFTHGSDPAAWNQGRTLADAIEQAKSVLAREAERRVVGGLLTPATRQLFLAPSVVQVIELEGGHGEVTVASLNERASEGFVVEVRSGSPLVEFPVALDAAWRSALNPTVTLPWVRLPDSVCSWSEVLKNPSCLRDTLAQVLSSEAHERVRGAEEMLLVLRRKHGTEVVLVQRPPGLVGVLMASSVKEGDPDSVLFNRVDGVTPQRKQLSTVPVAIIGAGSLGSAIALALVRAGITNLLLVDHDTLALDNVSRHVGSVADVGLPKVDVVKRVLHGVNPAVQVESIAKPLAWDMPAHGAGLEFERWCEAYPDSIVVSTCAFGPVERQLNEILVRASIPCVYASVLGPGHHGRVHRVIPGKTPCYQCVLDEQEERPRQFPRYVVDGVDQEERVPYLQPSLPGLAIDIGQISLVAARLTLQTIAAQRGIDLGLPDENGDHLLWTNRGGWAFDERPLQVRVERPERRARCSVCGPATDDAMSEAERLELEELLAQARRSRNED